MNKRDSRLNGGGIFKGGEGGGGENTRTKRKVWEKDLREGKHKSGDDGIIADEKSKPDNIRKKEGERAKGKKQKGVQGGGGDQL